MAKSNYTRTSRTTIAAKGKRVESTHIAGSQLFLFDKYNYRWMFIGLGLILLGFILMTGGKSPDPHQFNYDVIYSPVRVTLAPILILAGFLVEVYAIMKKPVDTEIVAEPTVSETVVTINVPS